MKVTVDNTGSGTIFSKCMYIHISYMWFKFEAIRMCI